ncbi:MAG: hypothetical protein IIZ17_04000 [Eubacteriaceae bacterium]|nr:hypothetical protein [Eubacteriaceae bacterium]
MERIKELFSKGGRYRLMPFCLSAAVINILAYYIPKLITARGPWHNLAIGFDSLIPLIPVTIIIYGGAFLQWVLYYLRLASDDIPVVSRYLTAEIISKAVCAVTFLVFPSCVSRPDIAGTDFFSLITKMMFFVDIPTCVFPSIHCLQSWLCMRYVLERKDFRASYKIFCVIFTLAVFASTVTMKQHAVVDIPAGILLGEICLTVCRHGALTSPLEKRMTGYLKTTGR